MNNTNTTYFKGDEAKFTGRQEVIAGATFDEILMLEGVDAGKLKLKISDASRDANALRFQEEFRKQQDGFRRLNAR